MAKKIGKGGSAAEKRRLEEAARQKRLQQNKGVKAGTIRPSAKGGGVRSYNAKTGRWDLLKGLPKAAAATSAKKTSTPMSGTVASAIASKKSSAAAATAKSGKGPRRPGESVGAYNDRIRDAPLANFVANLGSSGKSRSAEKAAARAQAAYMSGKPAAQPKPKSAAQKAADEAKARADRERAKAAARKQAKYMTGK